ncbi:hypothetical protein Srufu_052740 [Streptomyces libani subsp. rufus]|nr:hypothetical protein Srufu_052740 [Streptomyces libani subsp. rufus]
MVSVSRTMVAGTSLATILQNRQSACGSPATGGSSQVIRPAHGAHGLGCYRAGRTGASTRPPPRGRGSAGHRAAGSLSWAVIPFAHNREFCTMATTRTAKTHWEGNLLEGKGTVALESSKVGTYDVNWPARAEQPNGVTSPEELIAAAHSSCYSMAFSHGLAGKGYTVEALDTQADVTFQPGEGITGIALTVKARVPGLSEEDFQAAAQDAKANCPVSQALAGVKNITLAAELI